MRKVSAALLCVLVCVAIWPADCMEGGGTFRFNVIGPQDPTNLWQFASVRGWPAASSATTYEGGHNHARLVYSRDTTYFAVNDNACWFGLSTPDGTELVVTAEYSEGADAALQSWFAAALFQATEPAPTIPDLTMVEVPQASCGVVGPTVTTSWTYPTKTDAFVGAAVYRAAAVSGPWTKVDDVTYPTATKDDTPGSGTWYYAVMIRYESSPSVYSPRGKLATAVVP